MLPDKNDLESWIDNMTTEDIERLYRLVAFEPGTQIYRQQRFAELLDGELKRAMRNTRCLSLGLIRVDNYDDIVRRFGAAVAVGQMKQLTTIIKFYLREADIPVRYASDGFAVIMPEAPGVGARGALTRICDKILISQPPMEGAKPLLLSIGVAQFPTDAREQMEMEWKAKEGLKPYIPSDEQPATEKVPRDQILTVIAWHLIGGTSNWDAHCAGLMTEHGISTDEVRQECRRLME